MHRLSVGWAWQEFISDATSAVISTDNVDRKWLLVLIAVLNALIVCYLGGKAVLYFEQKPAEDAQSNSTGSGGEEKHFLGGSINHDAGKLRNSDSSLETPLL